MLHDGTGAVCWGQLTSKCIHTILLIPMCENMLCRLSGSISREVALLTYLSQLQLSNNCLNGSLEDGLWTLPQL
jgi:hypothetical protein